MTKIITTLSILSIGVLPQLSIAKVTAPSHKVKIAAPSYQIALSPSIAKLQSLVMNQQYQEAYDYAQTLAPTEAGNPTFDFLYGKAALNSNHLSEAVFALERARLNNPGNQNIDITLGRTYIKLKDLNSAEVIFNRIKTNPEAKTYLDQIVILKDQRRTIKFFRYEIGGGYDSNVDGLFKFGFPVGTPPSPTGTASWVNIFSGTAGITRKLSDNKSALYATLGLRDRPVYSAPRLNFLEVVGTAGYGTKLGHDFRINIPVHAGYATFGNQPFSNNVGIIGEISKALDKKRVHVVTASVDFEHFEYARHHIRDANQTIFTGWWLYTPAKPYNIVAKGFFSKGKNLVPTSGYLIRDYSGVEVTGYWNGIPRNTPYLTLIYINSDYQGVEPKFRKVRADNFYTARVGWAYQYKPTLIIEPSYSYNNSGSTINMFNYNRHFVQIALKGQFYG